MRRDLSMVAGPGSPCAHRPRRARSASSAVYDDGHVFEFAFSEVEELAGAVAGDATVVRRRCSGSVARHSSQRAAGERRGIRSIRSANDARLMLVKLLIGVGRVRRGEVLNGGRVRARAGPCGSSSARSAADMPTGPPAARHHRPAAPVRDGLPGVRRRASPGILDAPVEDAAREVVAQFESGAAPEPGVAVVPRRALRTPSHGELGWTEPGALAEGCS